MTRRPNLKQAIMVAAGIGLCLAAPSVKGQSWEQASKNLEVHGFVSQGYLRSFHNNIYSESNKDGTFQFNEFGMSVSTSLNDRLRAGLQLFSRDLGDIGNNALGIDWALLDYRHRDWLGLRAGKIKNGFGLYNYTRDYDMLRTPIFLPQSVYFEGQRNLQNAIYGVGIYGFVPLAALGGLNYQLQYGDLDLVDNASFYQAMEEFYGLAPSKVTKPQAFFGNLEWQTPLPGLRLAGSVVDTDVHLTAKPLESAWGRLVGSLPGVELNGISISVFSAEYTWREMVLAAEYLLASQQLDVNGLFSNRNREEAYYVSLSSPVCRWLDMGVYYNVLYPNRDDRRGSLLTLLGLNDYNAWEKRWVWSARATLSEFWTVKLEAHFIDGTIAVAPGMNPGGRERYTNLLAVKTTVHF